MNITYHELSNFNSGKLVSRTFQLDGLTKDEHYDEVQEWLDDLTEETGELCEEWIVCDSEGIPSNYVRNYSLDDEFFVYQEVIDELENNYGDDAGDILDAWLFYGHSIDESTKDNIEDAYNGKWRSDEDFVENMLEECGDIPKDIPPYIYIDWEATARDVMIDYFEHDGHYFRCL
jgi:antirestriction protein